MQGALLSCSYAVLDYAQTGLIAAVFIFKMMEWWYQSAEERLSAPTVYPPPPPAPTMAKKESLYLPTDPSARCACKNVQIHQLSRSLDLFSATHVYLSMLQSTSDVR
ncbi:PREDICTED: peroxisome biogenesis protein 12-like isoform X2 [Camelina sativa]|uniref:Peroxisome biogenesis protein 12-like isoform X2 n=1 Tax=Camelina sativa TaxID=90675 RepID=A0ABM0TEG1_CAMSA|nr:PREDICTED: peroxisome biogenesis protein 12-like isoform X2 [Camelina sativa]XP_010493279.1 PREDICTED: peroxisome biogenesis protein 12-like isoform X2 [Camelina sativa]